MATGVICERPCKGSSVFEWTVSEFFSRMERSEVHFMSPEFKFCESVSFLMITVSEQDDSWIDINLWRRSEYSMKAVTYKLDAKLCEETIKPESKKGTAISLKFRNVMCTSHLKMPDTLTITCTMYEDSRLVNEGQKIPTIGIEVKDLAEVAAKENVSDVETEDEDFVTAESQMEDMAEETAGGKNVPPVGKKGPKFFFVDNERQINVAEETVIEENAPPVDAEKDVIDETDREENAPPVEKGEERFLSRGTQIEDVTEQTDSEENLLPVVTEGEVLSRGTQVQDVDEQTSREENLPSVDTEGQISVSRETQTEDVSDSLVTEENLANVVVKVEKLDPPVDVLTNGTTREANPEHVNSKIAAYKQEIETLKKKLSEKEEMEKKLSSVNQKLSKLENRGTIQQKHFKEMLLKGKDHDVTFQVGDKVFTAHKNILRSRSPVFAAMFTHNMKEAKDDVVVIEDCDPNSFLEFLEFVYTGSIENLTVNNALGLYYAGDKYVFPDLKEMCVEYLKASMTTNVICDVITMAKERNEDELLTCAMAFFAKHLVDILRTVEWQRFLQCNPTLATELSISAITTSYQRIESS